MKKNIEEIIVEVGCRYGKNHEDDLGNVSGVSPWWSHGEFTLASSEFPEDPGNDLLRGSLR